jgi:glycosyltransferase involved in cell wall biosynthesis
MDRILHINDYPVEAGGGAEVVMSRTIALLREQGLTVATFTSADLAECRRSPLRYVDNSYARCALAAKLTAFRPDVVHLHNYYHVLSPGILGTLARYKRRRPLRVVMTAHDYHLICPNSGGSWFRWWTGRREAIELCSPSPAYLLAHNWDHRSCLHSLVKLVQHGWNYRWHRRQAVLDAVICPSRFVQAMLKPTGLKTCWLPHSVSPLPTIAPNREEPLRFVFAGRLEPEKGLNELLLMWPADSSARLTVIGEGGEWGPCEGVCAARKISDRVEFTGRLPHAETLARIARCHVLVQPSRVLETYGLTLIEALACGTNILAARRGAACEIVEATGVGFLYEPDDPASLAEQLQAIRQHHEAGALNRFDLADFLAQRSETRYIEQLLQIYANTAPAFHPQVPDLAVR